jgi:hypothetical protein
VDQNGTLEKIPRIQEQADAVLNGMVIALQIHSFERPLGLAHS